MDKKDNKIRPSARKPMARKVEKVKSEYHYNWEEFDKRTDASQNNKNQLDNQRSGIHLMTEEEIKKKYIRQQRQSELKMQRTRALMILFSAVLVAVILLFMTPIFNIRSISVAGNQIVTLEEIDNVLKDLVGENLFKTGSEKIKKRLSTIAYVEDASISKRIFPPSVKISITECEPAAAVEINGYRLILNSGLKILDDENILPADDIPIIAGINISGYKVGEVLKTDNSEKDEILKTCLELMEQTEIINDVNSIDISSVTGLQFVYQDRMNVLCGTQYDLQRKINLFRETILSNNIASDAKGTIDLTVAGKAVFDSEK